MKTFITHIPSTYIPILQTRTRTTFETPKYPRRPRDQYTAQIANTLGLSAPHQNWGKEKNPLEPGYQPGEASNKYMYICSSKKWSHCETVTLWNSLGACKTSSIPLRCHRKPNCQRRSSQSLVAVVFCWYRSFVMCICTNIHGSVVFSVLLPIDIENPHHYWNGLYP